MNNASGKSSKGSPISLGEITFHDKDDLLGWINTYLPTYLNFGGFIDIYGLM